VVVGSPLVDSTVNLRSRSMDLTTIANERALRETPRLTAQLSRAHSSTDSSVSKPVANRLHMATWAKSHKLASDSFSSNAAEIVLLTVSAFRLTTGPVEGLVV
jgi:hypothetical protein